MDAAKKYGKTYFLPPTPTYDWVKKDTDRKGADLVQRGSARRQSGTG